MHYQHGPTQHNAGLAAPCVSMHHSASAGNCSNLLRLPQAAAQDTARSGADCANGAHPAQFQETNRSYLFFSGSLYLRHRGPLGRTLMSWCVVTDTFRAAGGEAECCRGALPVCIQQLHPLEVHKQPCCAKRNGSLLTASARCFQRVWQEQGFAESDALRRMPHYRGKMRNSYLFS